jgi:hypothetical protein
MEGKINVSRFLEMKGKKNLEAIAEGLKKVISQENISALQYCLHFQKLQRKPRSAMISTN